MEVYGEQVGMCRGGEHLHMPHGLWQVRRVEDQTVGERELVCRTLACFEHSLKCKCTDDCLGTVGERELVCRTLACFEHSLKCKCTDNDCLGTVGE